MTNNKDLKDIRREYGNNPTNSHGFLENPLNLFESWFNEILTTDIIEPNAMALSTAGLDYKISSRMVLMKSFSANGFTFFTNYNSKKSKQINENPNASLLFYWYPLGRQVIIEGIVKKISQKESDEYFNSRPNDHKIATLASPQSEVIPSWGFLKSQYESFEKMYGNKDILRPSNWGGFILKPEKYEFWQGKPSRLHERIRYMMMDNGEWKQEILAP